MEYSHRDWRAHRDVARGFAVAAAAVGGFTLFALIAPWTLSGILAVIALALVGVSCVAWGERLVADYAQDLRSATGGSTTDGFLRAEVGSLVDFERAVGRPTERSPHSRGRSRATRVAPDPAAGKEP